MKNIVIFALLLPSICWGRWALKEDSSVIHELSQVKFEVKADGSYVERGTIKIQIRTEDGRRLFGTIRLPYNKETAEIKILQAKTLLDKTEIPVTPEFIEDKAFTTAAEGFDSMNQVTIAFPKVDAGSKVFLEYELKVKSAVLDGFFSEFVDFGTQYYEEAANYEYVSEVPLFIEVSDPENVLEVTKTKKDEKYVIQVRLKRPFYKEPVDERSPYIRAHRKTWIGISTLERPADMAKKVVDDYEKILSQPLPAIFEPIYESAKKQSLAVDQANEITSRLAETMRYLGDWRAVRGSHIPRPLEVLAKTKFGDCKDLATITTYLLRKLGLNAHVAWVMRSKGDYSYSRKIALQSEFNHAIVRLEGPDKKVYWIDPTNYTSFAQGVFSDISGREALILDAKNPRVEFIPYGSPEENQYQQKFDVTLVKDREARFVFEIDLKGKAATSWAGWGLSLSLESLKYQLLESMFPNRLYKEWNIEAFDLARRIVTNLKFKGFVQVSDFLLKTSSGPAYPLQASALEPLLNLDTRERVSDLYLSEPVEQLAKLTIKDMQVLGQKDLNCSVKSPWVSASRKIQKKKNEVLLEDTVRVQKTVLLNAEMQSDTFKKFIAKLRDCFVNTALILKPVKVKKQ